MGVFGSYVHGKQENDSDIDILIDLEKPIKIDLIALIELEYHLGELLDAKVDLVVKDNLKTRIGQHVLREVISV